MRSLHVCVEINRKIFCSTTAIPHRLRKKYPLDNATIQIAPLKVGIDLSILLVEDLTCALNS